MNGIDLLMKVVPGMTRARAEAIARIGDAAVRDVLALNESGRRILEATFRSSRSPDAYAEALRALTEDYQINQIAQLLPRHRPRAVRAFVGKAQERGISWIGLIQSDPTIATEHFTRSECLTLWKYCGMMSSPEIARIAFFWGMRSAMMSSGSTFVSESVLRRHVEQIDPDIRFDLVRRNYESDMSGPLPGFEYNGYVWLKSVRRHQRSIAVSLANCAPLFDADDLNPDSVNAVLDRFERRNSISLDDNQRRAVYTALTNPFAVITGVAGAGKTTAAAALVYVVRTFGHPIIVASPTAKAAQVLIERIHTMTGMTDVVARTIHSYFGLIPNESDAAIDEVVDVGVASLDGESSPRRLLVVFDETSMIGEEVAGAALAKAAPFRPAVVMFGDPQQLPSVSPGDLFRVLIEQSDRRNARVHLERSYRQAGGSGLMAFIEDYRLRQASITKQYGDDVVLLQRADDDRLYEDAVRMAFPDRIANDNVQIICPTREGVNRLNRAAIDWLFEGRRPFERGLHVGMRCVWTKNQKIVSWNDPDDVEINSDGRDLFMANGQMFTIVEYGGSYRLWIGIRLDGSDDITYITLDWYTEERMFVPAYALTVHKAQGSGWDSVFVVAPKTFYTRQLGYTAITRAKRRVVVIGDVTSFLQAPSMKPRRTSLPDAFAWAEKNVVIE
jgi:hypothetical protein